MAKVLVIGSGAREHTLAQTFLKSPQVTDVFCAPGNPGMVRDKIQTVDIEELDFDGLVGFAKEQLIDLTFVGPEVPLAKGVVDAFEESGLTVFGPNRDAARLESDKDFAKHFMLLNGIPTAQFGSFTDSETALKFATKLGFPVVVKQIGLAAGKGVAIVNNQSDLESEIRTAIEKDGRVLLEEFIDGEEFSMMVLLGKNERVIFPVSQDHKKIFAGDKGPNTGGMGAYSPVPHIDDSLIKMTERTIVDPTIKGLKAQHLDFNGVIYIGCILDHGIPKVIEYNLRFGDPETQVLLPQLKSDFYQLTMDLIAGNPVEAKFQHGEFYLGVVVAAPGYPEDPEQSILIPEIPRNVVFAGVQNNSSQLVSRGGRIFTIVDHAETLKKAQQKVYAELAEIDLSKFYYRDDIGYRDI